MRKGTMIAAAALAACLGAAPAGCTEEGGLGLADDLVFQGIVGGEETNYEIYKGVVGLYFPISSTQGEAWKRAGSPVAWPMYSMNRLNFSIRKPKAITAMAVRIHAR